MEEQTHQPMWQQMISALATIDAELDLPEDGCNSLAQTVSAIRSLKAQRRSAASNLAAATRRVAQLEGEQATMRKALTELLACNAESAGFSMSMVSDRAAFDAMGQRSQQRLEAAVAAARKALGMNAD